MLISCKKYVRLSDMAVPLEMLLHPELLTNEQLLTVIQERHLRIPNLQNMARDDLLNLFHNFCVPYGQRRYKDKGRGKFNKARQISPDSSSKINSDSGFMNHTIFNKESSRIHSDNYERLKPPPDITAGHTKRIKIATIAVPICNTNLLKRNNAVNSDNTTVEGPPQKKERKPITWP